MIEELINNLPELYQPVFGHDELTLASSRLCDDRLVEIEKIYHTFEKLLNRPLKVLDLGCAQGYFGFNLAKRGAIVTGIDHLKENIILCQALANENSDLQINFQQESIEKFVENLSPNEYDLVLGLSVFHHLIHERGIPRVKSMLEKLADLNGVLVLEMALQSEPCYWGPSQPDDPRKLIQDVGFSHLLSYHATHLSSILRPLFVASNYYCILDETALKFDSWTYESHALSKSYHKSTRRYYFAKDYILKLYRLDNPRGQFNKEEMDREINYLKRSDKGINCAQIIAAGSNDIESWICLQRLPGRLLLDFILNREDYDKHGIILSVLDQLTSLESDGLFHSDVRPWNILFDKESGTVYLIDYGSIFSEKHNFSFPYNLFLSFFIFVNEVAQCDIFDPVYRTSPISPAGLPEPYRSWANTLWQMPINNWSFKLMYETLKSNSDDAHRSSSQLLPMSFWMSAIERELQNLSKFFDHLISSSTQRMVTRVVQAEAIARSAETRAVQAEAIVETRAGQAEAVAKSAETRGGHAEAIAQAAETRALQAERIAHAAEARVVKAEAILQSAETRAVQAEAVAQSAEMRAVQAEAIAQSAESSGGQAEAIAQSAEMRAVRAEANAQAAETRAAEAEAIAKSAEMRGRQAEVIAQSAEMRAVQAEALAQSAEMSGEQAETFAQSAELRAVQAEAIAQSAELRAIQAEAIAEAAETRGRQAEAIAQAAEIRTVQVDAIAQSAETHAVNAETIARHAEARAVQAELIAYQYSMQLQALLATKSWRYTEPLRWFYRKLNIFRDLDPASRIKHLVVKVLRNLNQELLLRPKLRHHLLRLIRQFGLFSIIKKVYGKIKPPSEFSSMASSSQFYEDLSPVNLTPKAHQIYSLLKDAIDEHQK